MSDTAVITALIAAGPPTLVAIIGGIFALLSYRASRRNSGMLTKIHIDINSRITQLLEQKDRTSAAEAANARAEGKIEGKAEGS